MSKCKVVRSKDCAAGNHQFIVSNWLLSMNSQKANAYTCQKCLHTIEGGYDVKKLRDIIHTEDDTKAASAKTN